MENATKALIIAGSILIAIVLISVGIKILSSTSGVTKQANTVSDMMSVSMFNSQFTPYIGNGISGTQVKTLKSRVTAMGDNSQKPELLGADDINNSSKYNVSATYENGYIKIITVSIGGAGEPEIMVYITTSGTKYHRTSTCGGASSAKVTLTQAISQGKGKCGRCW